MQFRKAVRADLYAIMNIIKQAQSALFVQGVNQWQDGYPNHEVISLDIAAGSAYVCVIDGLVAAFFVISYDEETAYDDIYDGQWLSLDEYAVLHRIAVAEHHKGRGLATEIICFAEQSCLDRGIHSIKIDTHRDNKPMQRLLAKNDFRYCGIIYLTDGQARIAFEKCI